MKLLCVLFLAFIATLVTALPMQGDPQGRILAGQIAGEFDFPYQVGISLGRNINANLWCGGSYLSANWVLTAAHCLYGIGEVTLRYGSTNFTNPKVKITVGNSAFRIHPQYVPVLLDNDIAMIVTPTVPGSAYIWPVALPAIGAPTNYDGAIAVASGWGIAYENTPIDLARLRYQDQQVMPNSQCQLYYPKDYMTDGKMCVSLPQSICKGDSGGPLVIRSQQVQIGVSSFGSAIACGRSPSGFARVTEFLPWIKYISGIYY